VTLEDILGYLRIDDAYDIEDIQAYLDAAVDMCENYTQRAFIDQEWTVFLSGFDSRSKVIELPRSPAIELVSVDYIDEDGDEQTLDPELYWFDKNFEPPRLIRRNGIDWPMTQERPDAVTIVYKAGYGETLKDVPSAAKQAIRFMTSHFYEQRLPVVTGTITAELPLTARTLLNQIRVYSL
jgi:uncharacterized phiE125 gp8 family phage protein